jgi:hypothetical protein
LPKRPLFFLRAWLPRVPRLCGPELFETKEELANHFIGWLDPIDRHLRAIPNFVERRFRESPYSGGSQALWQPGPMQRRHIETKEAPREQ